MATEAARAWRWIAVAAAAGFALRALFGLTYWVGKPLTHDEREYLALAEGLAEGRGFHYPETDPSGTAQRFGRAPGYPMFLAAIGATEPDPGGSPVRVKLAQALVGALVVALVGGIALRAAGPTAARLAAGLATVHPPLVWYPAYVLSETLYSAVALTTAVVLQRAAARAAHERSSRAGGPLALAAGALTGAAILIRPAMLLFVPLAIAWLLRRRHAAMALALVAGAAAVVAPWTARNYRAYGRFVLVASEGGVTFWTGNHPLSIGEGDLAANPDLKQAELDFRRQHPGMSAEELEPLYYRDAFGHIAARPGWWLGLVARKAFYTVVPIGPSYRLHSPRYQAASIVPYLILLPFAVVGGRRLARSPRPPTAVFLLAAASLLVSLLFFPQERFRVPVIDPVLIVCAAASRRLDP